MVKILDTTLREGEQTPGVYMDVHIKLAVADMLDALGVDIIEAGHPAVTPEIGQAVRQIAGRGLRACVGAHARSLEKDVQLALDCGVGFLGIFYCVSEERLIDRSTSLSSAIGQITRAIRFARSERPDLLIRYTPEDAVRSPFENVVEAADAAVGEGADIISVADTTGRMIPGTTHNMFDYVSRLRQALADRGANPAIAVHCHNDRGLAIANALDAFRAGAEIIDATVLGLGERAGIVDIGTLMAVLAADFGINGRWDLTVLPELYRLVSRYSGLPIPVNLPVTGRNAFTHCAGVHTQAAARNPLHYQSLDPAIVGRAPEVALDQMSGMTSVRYCLEKIGMDVDDEMASAILQMVKRVGQSGRTVDMEELRHIVRYVRSEIVEVG